MCVEILRRLLDEVTGERLKMGMNQLVTSALRSLVFKKYLALGASAIFQPLVTSSCSREQKLF
jgi:hypothetical protein